MQDPPQRSTATVKGEFVIRPNVPDFASLELKVTRDDRSVRLHRQAAPVSDDVAAIGWPRYDVLRFPLPQGFDTVQLRLKLSLGVQAVPVPPSAITVTVHPATCAVTEPR